MTDTTTLKSLFDIQVKKSRDIAIQNMNRDAITKCEINRKSTVKLSIRN